MVSPPARACAHVSSRRPRTQPHPGVHAAQEPGRFSVGVSEALVTPAGCSARRTSPRAAPRSGQQPGGPYRGGRAGRRSACSWRSRGRGAPRRWPGADQRPGLPRVRVPRARVVADSRAPEARPRPRRTRTSPPLLDVGPCRAPAADRTPPDRTAARRLVQEARAWAVDRAEDGRPRALTLDRQDVVLTAGRRSQRQRRAPGPRCHGWPGLSRHWTESEAWDQEVMVMRVFVAGGTGVMGRRLVPQLVARATR